MGWVLIEVIYFGCAFFFPLRMPPVSGLLNRAIQALLLVFSIWIWKKDPNKSNKFIFLNFSLLFLSYSWFCVQDFVGVTIFHDWKYSAHVSFVYGVVLCSMFSSLTIVHIVIDSMFRHLRTIQKYAISIGVTIFFICLYYHPFLRDPLYLYSTEDIKQWKTLSAQASPQHHLSSAVDLAGKVRLQSWRDGHPVGDLYPDENLKRIEYLLPYLEGDNWRALLQKPLYVMNIYMNIMFIVFILLFFGYQYKKDPPQGAYIDKIMFLLLLFSSMEILHYWGFVRTIEYNLWSELIDVGQYITIAIEILLVFFFALRLKFITSVQGEFYETELVANPQQVSRWRDWIDNLILSHFFNYKKFHGRLFQDPQGN